MALPLPFPGAIRFDDERDLDLRAVVRRRDV